MTAPAPPHLDEADQQELLRLARATLVHFTHHHETPRLESDRPALNRPAAAFVTVYVRGHLRGCIGRLEPDQPLVRTVAELTVSAAARDPRFPPVAAEEVGDARLEISVLDDFRRVDDVETIEIGRHGLIIGRGHHRGLLLPKVAVEHRMDRETFLAETCWKAGLDSDAWRRPGTTIESFVAQVFAEA